MPFKKTSNSIQKMSSKFISSVVMLAKRMKYIYIVLFFSENVIEGKTYSKMILLMQGKNEKIVVVVVNPIVRLWDLEL